MKKVFCRGLAIFLAGAMMLDSEAMSAAPTSLRPGLVSGVVFEQQAFQLPARWFDHVIHLSNLLFYSTRLIPAFENAGARTAVGDNYFATHRPEVLQPLFFKENTGPSASGSAEPSHGPKKPAAITLDAPGKLRQRLKAARRKGSFGVLSVAMEMPLINKEGKRFKQPGPGGGGQGVVMEEQPLAVSEQGVATAIMAPLFKAFVEEHYHGNLDAYLADFNGQRVMNIEIPVGAGTIPLEVLYIEQEGVAVLQLYDATGGLFHTLYADPVPDSLGSYIEAIVLPRAAFEVTRKLGIQFEAYHFNDWQTSFGPVFLHEQYASEKWPLGHRPAALFTIHNLEYKGEFPGFVPFGDPRFKGADLKNDLELKSYLAERNIISVGRDIDLFALTGLNPAIRDRVQGGMEFWSILMFGRHSLMKGAISYSDRIVFVSAGHATEARTRDRGYGLDGLIAYLWHRVRYVYNGIRANRHRPQFLTTLDETGQGPYGAYRFTRPQKDGKPVDLQDLTDEERMLWKKTNKVALQNKLGLEVNENNILLGFVSRLVKQKGFNILMEQDGTGKSLLQRLLDVRRPDGSKVQIVIEATSGDARGERQAFFFEDFVRTHPEYKSQFIFVNEFNRDLAKQIGAASDLMGMFSIDEPGGIANQEFALLLAIVIATDRGGLKDFKESGGTPSDLVEGYGIDETIEAVQQRERSATQILDRVRHYLTLYRDHPSEFAVLLRKLAHFNPDWGNRTQAYVDIYREAIQSVDPSFVHGARTRGPLGKSA